MARGSTRHFILALALLRAGGAAPSGAVRIVLVVAGVRSVCGCALGSCSDGSCGAFCASSCNSGTYGGACSGGSCSCNPCAAGTSGGGGNPCTSCSAGKSSSAGSSSCTDCPAGQFNAVAGGLCSNCAPGKYGAVAGLSVSTCTDSCAAGYFGASLTTRTTPSCSGLCLAGYYGESTGLSVSTCTAKCAAGFFGLATTVRTSASCDGLCACGRYGSSGESSNACGGPCPAGRFGLATTARTNSSCDGACTAGFYCPAGSCSPSQFICPSGSYCPPGSGDHVPCPSGTWNNVTGAVDVTACTPCAPGTYSVKSGALWSSTCTACPAGTASATVGAASASFCVPCSPGTFSAEGASTCPFTSSSCPVGTFANVSVSACVRCAPATACPVAGLNAQLPCFWNVSSFVGGGSPGLADGIGYAVQVNGPSGVAVDLASRNVYAAESGAHRIRKVSPMGLVTTLAGSGVGAFRDGVTTAASFFSPQGLAFGADSNLFSADCSNNRIRVVSPSGVVTTFAGSGVAGGADGDQLAAQFDCPSDIVFSLDGTQGYIVERGGHRIRSIVPSTGVVTTLSGSSGGFADGPLSAARFNGPTSAALHPRGAVYIADSLNHRVRVLNSGAVSTLAGNGTVGGADGSAATATFNLPFGLYLDAAAEVLYVSEQGGHRIRSISLSSARVATVAGSVGGVGASGYRDDFSVAALFNQPAFVGASPDGALYASDAGNSRVRLLTCAVCPASFYCASGAPVICPAGSYCPFSSLTPTPCPAGTYLITTGAASNASCAPCEAGFYCETPLTVTNCPQGSYCPQGSFKPILCAPGSYTPNVGRKKCTLCLQGSYAPLSGSLSCDESCPAGYYGAARGGSSIETACTECPPGRFSASEGALSCSNCPDGTSTKAGATSCAPEACPAPLAFSSDRLSCVGCGNGTSGVYPSCVRGACASNSSVCPGLTAAPLVSFSSPTRRALSCATLDDVIRLVPARTDAKRPGIPWLSRIFPVDVALLLNANLFIAIFLLYCGARFFATAPVTAFFERCDMFAVSVLPRGLVYPVDGGFVGVKPVRGEAYVTLGSQQRGIGGLCSVLSVITTLTAMLVLVLQRDADNVSRQESVIALTRARLDEALSLPVFSDATLGSGVQLRITAAGNGGVCASNVTWSATESGWALVPSTQCGEGSVSQLVFSCSSCVLSPTSALKIALPYSCQSLVVEAAALDAAGVVTYFVLPLAETRAASGEILSNISWSLPALFSVVNSTVSPSARGYILTDFSHKVASQNLTRVDSGVGLLNPTATIELTVSFPLNTFYTLTVLSEKQSVAMLLSSIIGLAGIIGAFRGLLGVHEYFEQLSQKGGAPEKRDAALLENATVNPLANGAMGSGSESDQIVLHAVAPPPPQDSAQEGHGGNGDTHASATQTNPIWSHAETPLSSGARSSGILPRDGSQLTKRVIHAAALGHLQKSPLAAAMAREFDALSPAAWGALSASVSGGSEATRLGGGGGARR